MAALLDRNPSSVSRLETGDSAIAADDLPVILSAYGLSVAQFAVEAKRA